MAIETRGVVADWDARTGTLHVWDTTQAPISIRNGLAYLFKLPESRVIVQAPDFAVGDDVETGAFHVADGRVGGIVEHLLEVARAELAGLEGLDGGEPPAGLAVGSHDGGRNEGKGRHQVVPPITRRTAGSLRTSSGRPAKMISPRSITYKRVANSGTWWILDSAMRMAWPR